MLNRNDDQNEAKRMVLFCVAAASMVLLLFLVALYMNDSKKAKTSTTNHKVEESTNGSSKGLEDLEIGESNLVSSDLDFWDMYSSDVRNVIDEDSTDDILNDKDKLKKKSSTKSDTSNSKTYEDNDLLADDDDNVTEKQNDDPDSLSISTRNKSEKEKTDNANRFKVKGTDGTIAWFDILEDVSKNKYNFKENLLYDNGMLKYNSSDYRSTAGIDISNYQGTIDFAKVRNAGIDYVMIKVAGRGYESGQINIDDKFIEYANGATTAGLSIGAYITSNAITDVEAIEEANYAIAASNSFNVRYPIAIDLMTPSGTKTRTDRLTSSERTKIVKVFCDTVRTYGRTPAICASKEYLIANLDLSELKEYDIWLKDEAVVEDYMKVEYINDRDSEEDSESSSSSSSSRFAKSSSSERELAKSPYENEEDSYKYNENYVGTDYPYVFSMWQYSGNGTINGVDGKVNLNISFVNYAER